MAANVPAQQPPRDLRLAPSSYLPPGEHAVVSSVSTSRRSPDPGNPDMEREFSSSVTVDATAAPRPASEQSVGEAGEKPDASWYPPSVFEDALGDGKLVRVSESCKFSPTEQQNLIGLRRKVDHCAGELQALCALLADESGAASGLPSLRDSHRCRLGGRTFSAEDAKRDLCNSWLLDRLNGYVAFVDHALADELDERPNGPTTRKLSKDPPPATFTDQRQSRSPPQSPQVTIAPSPTPKIGSFGLL
eukprot:gnl/TRDRNA2_/TRDRNA2_54735_c0_seq1.p1 gnl/TRDRNA2_/TRDRNA2_54735_c0~~gnl/TRDRNA2_/TRDRNA2_54735_c0_seq1.p1  ORF type:complete len:262 (+),score=43.10 gnl/TRDRNA2_/TRDRNA2_54735_c0_seq1:46-786(+)